MRYIPRTLRGYHRASSGHAAPTATHDPYERARAADDPRSLTQPGPAYYVTPMPPPGGWNPPVEQPEPEQAPRPNLAGAVYVKPRYQPTQPKKGSNR